MTNPYLVGDQGPCVLVPARVAAFLESRANLTALRVRVRGLDPEVSAALEALHIAALSWRGSATGTEGAVEPEPATDSGQWLSTTTAADLAGVSSRAIRRAIAEGRLPATQVGGRHRVSREELGHYRARRAS